MWSNSGPHFGVHIWTQKWGQPSENFAAARTCCASRFATLQLEHECQLIPFSLCESQVRLLLYSCPIDTACNYRHIRDGTRCAEPHGPINCPPADIVPSYRWRNCDFHQTLRESVPETLGHPWSPPQRITDLDNATRRFLYGTLWFVVSLLFTLPYQSLKGYNVIISSCIFQLSELISWPPAVLVFVFVSCLCCLLFGVFVCFVCFWVFCVCFLSCTVTAQWIMYRSDSVLFCLTLSLWPMLPLH